MSTPIVRMPKVALSLMHPEAMKGPTRRYLHKTAEARISHDNRTHDTCQEQAKKCKANLISSPPFLFPPLQSPPMTDDTYEDYGPKPRNPCLQQLQRCIVPKLCVDMPRGRVPQWVTLLMTGRQFQGPVAQRGSVLSKKKDHSHDDGDEKQAPPETAGPLAGRTYRHEANPLTKPGQAVQAGWYHDDIIHQQQQQPTLWKQTSGRIPDKLQG